METSNVLIAAGIAGFLYLGGYVFIAKLVIGLVALIAIFSAAASSLKKSKSKSSSQDNVMDPIEIETVKKPDYKIPEKTSLLLKPDKDPKNTRTGEALKGTFGVGAKWLGKKLKD